MPFNGSGTFLRVHNWVDDANSSIPITDTRVDEEDDGYATGLSNCVTRDGQSTPTADLPMDGFKHTGVEDASSRNQYASLGQVQDAAFVWGGTAGGTANVITVSASPAPASYVAGLSLQFISSADNSGAVTLNVNSLGAKNVTKRGTVALTTGDIPANAVVRVVYDGTQFQLLGCDMFSQGSDIASAGTLNIDSATWNVVDVTGTTTITAISLAQGREVTVRFTGALTLTNGASLVLPTGANITTAAGDYAVFRGYASGVVRCTSYTRANGAAVLGTTYKIGNFTRDISLTGTQAITGVGFRPRVIHFLACVGVTSAASIGFDDGLSPVSIINSNNAAANTWSATSSYSIQMNTPAGNNNARASVTSTGSDGFTLTWDTVTGTPTGTASIYYLAIR